jgi:hypothetical protein
MKKLFALILILLINTVFHDSLYSQTIHRCGSSEYLQKKKSENPAIKQKISELETKIQRLNNEQYANDAYRKTNDTTIITIPVVVHVVYKKTEENISDAQIQSQIDVLNEDYNRKNPDSVKTPIPFRPLAGSMKIKFELAVADQNGKLTTGIIRKYTNKDYFTYDDAVKYDSSGGSNAWNYNNYLNLWTCNLQGLLGYATLPGTAIHGEDGVVIAYNAFGRVGTLTATYDLGRTATHEVGHWFNLLHVWGSGSGCGDDDGVTDTPLQDKNTFGCPTFPLIDSCTGAPNGVMYMNYMDYSDDICMNIFTKGQVARMNTALTIARPSILTSPGTILSVNDIISENKINVYPNPNTGLLFIENSNSVNLSYIIFDILGNKVLEGKTANQTTTEIKLNNIPSGVYYIHIHGNGFTQNKKIIVTN